MNGSIYDEDSPMDAPAPADFCVVVQAAIEVAINRAAPSVRMDLIKGKPS